MFDTYASRRNAEESGSDETQTEKIAKLMELDPKKHRPPKVTFRYGSLIFSGVITELNQTFTMFLANGMLVRQNWKSHSARWEKKTPMFR